MMWISSPEFSSSGICSQLGCCLHMHELVSKSYVMQTCTPCRPTYVLLWVIVREEVNGD